MTLRSPLRRPLRQPLRSVFDGGVGGGSAASSFSSAKLAIESNAADVSILVIGDSTGDQTSEWVYLFSQWLAAEYPTHTVEYYGWDDAVTNYLPPVVLSAGTGSRKIKVWNASLSGSRPDEWMDARYAPAIKGKSANLVIWNHGHNITTVTPAPTFEARYAPWVERVQLEYPSAGLAITSQNPSRDTDAYAPKDQMIRGMVAAKPRALLIDVYSKFIELGKPSALYMDGIHPSVAGSVVWADLVKSYWTAAARTSPPSPSPWMHGYLPNLMPNGDFSAFSGATPDGWSKGGTGTVTKDVGVVAPGSAYSVRIENTAASGTYLVRTLDAPGLASAKAAGVISVAALRRMLPSPIIRVGLFSVQVVAPSTGTLNYSQQMDTANIVTDAWNWGIVRDIPVPADATAIGVYIYASSTASAGPVAYFDRVVVVPGATPRDAE